MRVDESDAGTVPESRADTEGFEFAEKDGDVSGVCVGVLTGDRLGVLDVERDVDCVRVTDTDAVDDGDSGADGEAAVESVAFTESEGMARVSDGASDGDARGEPDALGDAVFAATVGETDAVNLAVRDGASTVGVVVFDAVVVFDTDTDAVTDVLGVDVFDLVDVAVTVADARPEGDRAVVGVFVGSVDAEPRRASVGETDTVTHAVVLVDCELSVVGERDAHDADGTLDADGVTPGLAPGAADREPIDGVDVFVVDTVGDAESRAVSVPFGTALPDETSDGVWAADVLHRADALGCDADARPVGDSLVSMLRVAFARHDALTVPLTDGLFSRVPVASAVVEREMSADGLADVVDDTDTVVDCEAERVRVTETVAVDDELGETRADAVATSHEGDTVLVDDCESETVGRVDAVPDGAPVAEYSGDGERDTDVWPVTEGDAESVV